MNENKIIIQAIKTDIGYFAQLKGNNSNYNQIYGNSGLEPFLFDGKSAEPTHAKNWVKIKKIPKKIEREVVQPQINHRFELIDSSLKSEKFPSRLAAEYDTDESYWKLSESYTHLKFLYELKADSQPNLIVNVDFEFNIILEMDNIKEYGGFSYEVPKISWDDKYFPSITNKDVGHETIDTILFPDIILPAKKSNLTSEQTYKIIRRHIQNNINPKYAHITSDYDFCFTVKKKIPLAAKIPYERDISRYGARKPKYIEDFREIREIEIFEMTSEEKGYKGYTPIEGFKGGNIKELKENIDNYLKDLMDKINEPVIDCPHCHGKGIVLNKK